MYVRLLVSVLFLSATSSAAFVINVDDYIKDIYKNIQVNPRDIFDVSSFLTGHGYPFENHRVTTEDGYVLSLHRIPHGKDEAASVREDKPKPAVLLMHGLLASSVEYFILPNSSLAMILADLGYDVWLGNNRGNTWSRKHTTLDPDENDDYWSFSFHELGAFDVPATIDYILNATKNEKLTYIGHSQGCTEFFVTTSLKPEYNEKITLMAALGPPVFVQNLTNPLVKQLATFYPIVEMVLNNFNITEFLPYTSLSTTLQVVCDSDSGIQEVCAAALFFLFGFDSEQLDRDILPIILQDLPAGASAKEILHFLQQVKSGHFRQYDHGEEINREIYNSAEPPDYNLKQVTAPVALYYGENDWMVGIPDMDRLIEALPNIVEDRLIGYQLFNHLDFIFAKDVVNILYYDVINLINTYNGFDLITTTPSGSTTKSTTRRPRPTTTTSQTTTTDNGGTTSNSTVSPPTTPSPASTLRPNHLTQMQFGVAMLVVIYLLA